MAASVEATMNYTDPGSDPKPPVLYRCKKCRRIVATEEHVVTHERGGGQKCFKWKKRSADSDMEAPDCSSIFVEPMKWMQSVEEGCVGDKLQCIMYRLQSPIRFLQLGGHAVQLWGVDQSRVSAAQKSCR